MPPLAKQRVEPVDPVDKHDALSEKLYLAVCQRNIPAVKQCIEEGVQLERSVITCNMDPCFFFDGEGALPPLHFSVLLGSPEIVTLLLDAGADVNGLTCHQGNTALFVATLDFKMDMVQLLIDRGADVTIHGSGDYSPLHLAVEQELYELVELFIDNGANFAATEQMCLTPLGIAIRAQNEKMIRFLIALGADVNQGYITPLVAAISPLFAQHRAAAS